MPDALSELPELIEWLTTTIEPLHGSHWQITLNGNGNIVEATARIVEDKHTNARGHTMTISRVVQARFRLGSSARRTIFRTE